MTSLSGRVHLSFPPAAVEGRGGLQGGRFEASHRLEGGGRRGDGVVCIVELKVRGVMGDLV